MQITSFICNFAPLHNKTKYHFLQTFNGLSIMKAIKFNKALMLTAFAGLAFTSCSNSDDGDVKTPGNLTNYSFKLEKTAETFCSSNDITLGQKEQWYQKIQDFRGAGDEQNKQNHPYYFQHKDKAPTTDGNVDQAEKEFVLNYLSQHPNEGSTDFSHYNYYIQNVGGSYASYTTAPDMNNATSSVTGSNQMDFVEFKDQNGEWKHINDYNANYGPVALVLNTQITGARYHDSWGSNTWESKYKFYEIEYNGQKNLYLCFDYGTKKDGAGIAECCSDGVYNDWVIKVIPACDNDEPGNVDPVDPTPTPEQPSNEANGMVEVNLSAQDHKDEECSKLSVHVRDTCNFKVFIPVPATAYCEADDMYIVEKHYDKMSYNEQTTVMEREINGQNVTLTVTYVADGIYIESQGINAKVLEYCRNVYGDGITFEVWNYYNTEKLTREALLACLNQTSIEFTDKQPKEYKNTKVDINVDQTGKELDCTVTKK